MVWLTIITVIVLIIIFYYKAIKPLSYWKERGVPHKKPLPLIGNSKMVFLPNIPFAEYILDIYNEFPNERYFGIHQFLKPALFIRDLDLIKRITIKNFDHFVDHHNGVPEDIEPLFGKNLINLKGQKWRDMRATLSPSFSSSKMKTIFALVSECAHEFTQFFEKKDESIISVELKDTFSRFANDVIASVAFGLKCDSLAERNNEFYMMGRNGININKLRYFQLILCSISPYLAKLAPVTLLPTFASTFFRRIIQDTIERREKEGFVRHDMIHLLMEAKKGNLRHDDISELSTEFSNVEESKIHMHGKHKKLELTEDDLIAQALVFFIGGFDTSSTLMCFIGYELTVNREIQKRLQSEIDQTLKECNGKLTYDALQRMKYMDMVVSETLRKWPPLFQMDRVCVKDYTVEPSKPSEKSLVIEKGTVILFPVIGIQRDPKYFSNPHVFDPERFNDENKHQIEPCSYFPFGSGPRSCIASRFALMENKALIFNLLSKFDMVVTDKTEISVKLDKNTYNLIPPKGFWIGLRRRKFA